MLVLPSIITASRKVVAARLTTLRVRELSTRWPLILLLGFSPIHETNAFSLRHFAILVPISLSRFKTARIFNPGIVVRSTPRMRLRCSAKLNSKASLGFLLRGLQPAESCDCGIDSEARLRFVQSAIFVNCFSMLRSHRAHLRFVKIFAGLLYFFMEERAACCGR